jgi:uncharacterized protein YlxW (UPF0749 family)
MEREPVDGDRTDDSGPFWRKLFYVYSVASATVLLFVIVSNYIERSQDQLVITSSWLLQDEVRKENEQLKAQVQHLTDELEKMQREAREEKAK